MFSKYMSASSLLRIKSSVQEVLFYVSNIQLQFHYLHPLLRLTTLCLFQNRLHLPKRHPKSCAQDQRLHLVLKKDKKGLEKAGMRYLGT